MFARSSPALRERRMASSLRRLIEQLAVVKPAKASRSTSEAAKAAFGLDVPITEVLDNTLGPAGQSAAATAAQGPTG